MKHILLIFAFSILSVCGVSAQDVTYCVGHSENPDPIMRHHEALMDAFMQFFQHESKAHVSQSSGQAYSRDAGRNANSSPHGPDGILMFETVSSVTHGGSEELVISIGGSGVPVKVVLFTGKSDSVHATILEITYKDESGGNLMESVHRYEKKVLTGKDNSGKAVTVTSFKYQCLHNNKNE